jgi:hypothetical protein
LAGQSKNRCTLQAGATDFSLFQRIQKSVVLSVTHPLDNSRSSSAGKEVVAPS